MAEVKMKTIKLAFLGDSIVGKTSIIEAFMDEEFNDNFISTIGWDTKKSKIKLDDGNEMELSIWDTAGQERYQSIALKVIKQVQGIIVVFDITKEESFKNVAKWLEIINDNFTNVSIILFGNKCDLEDKREVSKEDAIKFATSYNLTYLETSAKTNTNIKEGILKIANEVYIKYKNVEQPIKLNNKKGKKKKPFCGGGKGNKKDKKEDKKDK